MTGERFDGHNHVSEAFEKGACGAVVNHRWAASAGIEQDRILYPVPDPLRALQDIATHYRNRFEIPVIAITGTNGKTTTKEMVAAVLETRFRVMKSIGNFNNHIGVPLNICTWSEDAETAVLEMGTNHFGEIARLCEIARPTIGMITNIGKGHLEFFGDEVGVLKAKSELLESLVPDGLAILNGDDEWLKGAQPLPAETVWFGFGEGNDVQGVNPRTDGSGCPSMEVDGESIRIMAIGRHQLSNALAAAAVGKVMGLSIGEIKAGLEVHRPVGKRMMSYLFSGLVVIDDSYNANPSSLLESMKTLRSCTDLKRRFLVLGDMLELGEHGVEDHRRVGDWASDMEFDGLFVYGPLMANAAERGKEMGMETSYHFNAKTELLEALVDTLEDGDGVLVKGSRGMRMEEIVDGLKERFHEKDEE